MDSDRDEQDEAFDVAERFMDMMDESDDPEELKPMVLDDILYHITEDSNVNGMQFFNTDDYTTTSSTAPLLSVLSISQNSAILLINCQIRQKTQYTLRYKQTNTTTQQENDWQYVEHDKGKCTLNDLKQNTEYHAQVKYQSDSDDAYSNPINFTTSIPINMKKEASYATSIPEDEALEISTLGGINLIVPIDPLSQQQSYSHSMSHSISIPNTAPPWYQHRDSREKILFNYDENIGDRRHKIVTKEDGRAIMFCIGRIKTSWKENKTKHGYGTGTVFHYNPKTKPGTVVVITCAHNIITKGSQISNVKHDRDKIYKAQKIWFQRWETFDGNLEPRLLHEYQCEKYEYHEKYSLEEQCPNDLALLWFKDDDGFYAKLFSKYEKGSDLVKLYSCNRVPGDIRLTYEIYGFPFTKGATQTHKAPKKPDNDATKQKPIKDQSSKPDVTSTSKDQDDDKEEKDEEPQMDDSDGGKSLSVDNGNGVSILNTIIRNGELWGMAGKSSGIMTVDVNENEGKSDKRKKEVDLYFQYQSANDMFWYNSVDTQGGQSGSAILLSLNGNNGGSYGIVGIHTGGDEDMVKNWGTALTDRKLKWIQNKVEPFTIKEFFSGVNGVGFLVYRN